jgi:hypothetical protein
MSAALKELHSYPIFSEDWGADEWVNPGDSSFTGLIILSENCYYWKVPRYKDLAIGKPLPSILVLVRKKKSNSTIIQFMLIPQTGLYPSVSYSHS